MEKGENISFRRNSFGRRLKSMLSVDFRRMFTMPLFYIMAGVAAVIPVLVLVMTTAVGGTTSIDPVTGLETVVEMEPFTNTWQVVESVSGESSGISGIVMCLLSKALLMAVFVPIYLLWSVMGKQKLWLSMMGSFAVGMLFFMMIPMLTPLDSGIINVVMCLAGGTLFSGGLGAVSGKVLNATSLV